MPEKYRPTTDIDRDIHMELYCFNCKRFGNPMAGDLYCSIAAATYSNDISAPNYPAEWTYDENGAPTCTAFEGE